VLSVSDTSHTFVHAIYIMRLHVPREFAQITNHPEPFYISWCSTINENSRTSREEKGRQIDRARENSEGPKPSICFGLRHVELPPIRLLCIRTQSARELYGIALGPTVNCYQLWKHPLPFAYHTHSAACARIISRQTWPRNVKAVWCI